MARVNSGCARSSSDDARQVVDVVARDAQRGFSMPAARAVLRKSRPGSEGRWKRQLIDRRFAPPGAGAGGSRASGCGPAVVPRRSLPVPRLPPQRNNQTRRDGQATVHAWLEFSPWCDIAIRAGRSRLTHPAAEGPRPALRVVAGHRGQRIWKFKDRRLDARADHPARRKAGVPVPCWAAHPSPASRRPAIESFSPPADVRDRACCRRRTAIPTCWAMGFPSPVQFQNSRRYR